MIKAVMNNIVGIEMQQSNVSAGGIIIPETAQREPQLYIKVLSVGPEVTDKNIQEGQIVLAHKHGGQAMMIDLQVYRIFKDTEIFAIYEGANV